MNYLVIRDDLGGFNQRTPSFNAWWFAEDVDLAQHSARFQGQFGVDTDLYVAVPSQATLFKDTFIHDQCEPIVSSRHQARFGKPFREKQVLCRVEGQKGQGFLIVLFPYQRDEARPLIENWQGDKGVKVAWKKETHYILLDTVERDLNADGIRARTSSLVLKVTDSGNFSLTLPAGGEADYQGRHLKGGEPCEVVVREGQALRSSSTDLLGQ